MPKKIAWVTDSTASFSKSDESWLKENDIYIVPLYVNFEKETFKEGVDISTEDFYKRMKEEDQAPTSSQPAIGDFIELYETLKDSYDEAIIIHASSELTGTYSTSFQAAAIVGLPVHPVDSWIGAFALKFMIEEGVRFYKAGYKPSEIVDELLLMREKTQMLLLPANLDQLRKSGRVSNIGSLLGNLMQIKPILAFKEGKVNIIEKIRTMKKAEVALITKLSEAYKRGIHDRIGVMYAGEKEHAERLIEKVKEEYQHLKIELLPLIPVAGVHTGVGTIALSWIEKSK